MANIRPLGSRIYVQREKPDERTHSGIYIPDAAKDRCQTYIGKVLAVGPGSWVDEGGGGHKTRRAIEVRVNQRVLFGRYTGHDASRDSSGDFWVLDEKDVLGVVED